MLSRVHTKFKCKPTTTRTNVIIGVGFGNDFFLPSISDFQFTTENRWLWFGHFGRNGIWIQFGACRVSNKISSDEEDLLASVGLIILLSLTIKNKKKRLPRRWWVTTSFQNRHLYNGSHLLEEGEDGEHFRNFAEWHQIILIN